jgi:dolichyl-phosphate-mannose--protein O-mannosyl transferase
MAGGITWSSWAVSLDVLLLLATAALARLWDIDSPNSVVFDEYHFGRFVNWCVVADLEGRG